MLFAVTIGPITAFVGVLGLLALVGVVGVLVALAVYFVRQRLAADPTATPASTVAEQALSAAFVADREGLGVFKSLLKATHANDRDRLLQEFKHLVRLVKEQGTFAKILEPFFYGQIRAQLADPTRRRALLDYLSGELGIDLHAALAAAPVKLTAATPNASPAASKPTASPSPTTAVASAVLLAVAILFGAATASAQEFRGPQLFEPDERGAIVDPPTFPAAPSVQAGYGHAPAAAGPGVGWKRVGDLTFDDYVLQRPMAPNGWTYANGYSVQSVRRRACVNCRYRR